MRKVEIYFNFLGTHTQKKFLSLLKRDKGKRTLKNRLQTSEPVGEESVDNWARRLPQESV